MDNESSWIVCVPIPFEGCCHQESNRLEAAAAKTIKIISLLIYSDVYTEKQLDSQVPPPSVDF